MHIFLILMLVLKLCALQPTPKLKVAVYYETYSNQSKQLFAEQLRPIFDKNWSLLEQIELSLVPFGMSKHRYDSNKQKYVFSCHRGPRQCTHNLWHACALNTIGQKNQCVDKQTFQLLECMMKNCTEENYRSCLQTNRVSMQNQTAVDSCTKSENGGIYLANYGTQTDSVEPPLQSFPTVVFNDEYDDEVNKAAINDFAKVLNNRLKIRSNRDSTSDKKHNVYYESNGSGHAIHFWPLSIVAVNAILVVRSKNV